MKYWLIKSEPSTWALDDQERDKTTAWTGVRNHQATKYLKAMQVGDKAFFYHSVSEKSIVGIVTITRTAYPDPTDADGKFVCVDVTFESRLKNPVSLATIKTLKGAETFPLIKQARLSVMPVEDAMWQEIVKTA